jgi:hypothetical protein
VGARAGYGRSKSPRLAKDARHGAPGGLAVATKKDAPPVVLQRVGCGADDIKPK